MNSASGFHEVRSSPPDHQQIGCCTSNSLDSEQFPDTIPVSRNLSLVILVLGALSLLWLPSLWAADPITPSGLHTQVSDPIMLPANHIQYDITGGTRPGGTSGTNLFHSFGDFNVPTNNIANFLNDSGLATSNILGRVTGGNISNIYGTIQTTGFGNANLFLMNPAGFLFGPNATVNIGGMATFTTADYMRLTDGGRFNANPNAIPSDLLTAAPVAAFGFLGSVPQAINFEGGQLTVTNGTGITLVGGDINLGPDPISGAPSSVTASGRQIQLTSVVGPGELAADTGRLASEITGGSINLGPGTLVDVSGNAGGTVRIRGGSLVMENAVISADTVNANDAPVAIDINVTGNISISSIDVPALTARTTGTSNAGGIQISSGSMDVTTTTGDSFLFAAIDTHTSGSGNAGNINIATGDLTVTGDPFSGGTFFIDSGTSGSSPGRGGDLTISAGSIELQDTAISTGNLLAFFLDEGGAGTAGNVTITADHLQMTLSQIVTDSNDFVHPTGRSGDITITAHEVSLNAGDMSTTGNERSGAITITADQLVATESQIQAITNLTPGGDVKITGNVIEFRNGSNIASSTMGDGDAGPIIITATNHLGFLDSSPGGRPSGIFNNSFGENGSLGKAGDVVITTPSLQLTGGARINTTTATSGAGGNVTITANNSTSMSGENSGFEVEPLFNLGTIQSSGIYTRTIGGNCIGPCGNAGNVSINTGSLSLGSGSQINSGTSSSGQGGSISVNASNTISISGTLSNGQPGGIQSRTVGTDPDAGPGGNIALTSGQSVTISNGASVSASSTGAGDAGNVTVQGLASPAQSVLIDGAGSGIITDTQGTGAGGNIIVNANSVTLQNGGTLSAATSGTVPEAIGGTIMIDGNIISLSSGTLIDASTNGSAPGGSITLRGNQRISAVDSFVATNAQSSEFDGGDAGRIQFVSPVIDLQSTLVTSSTLGGGRAGDIILEGSRISLSASPFYAPFDQGTNVLATTEGPGSGGNIIIRGFQGEGSRADSVLLTGFTQILTETIGNFGNEGNAGTITVDAAHLSISDSTRMGSESLTSAGDAGSIHITADEVTISQSLLSTSTDGLGNAGTIEIMVGALTMNANGQIVSSSVLGNPDFPEFAPTGNAGTVTIHGLASPSQSILIDGSGSGIFTDTQGTGTGGNILINANSVTLQNGAELSAKTMGTASSATGGTITVDAANTITMNGASITAKSEGVADAGSIDLTAMNGFTMQHSSITTQAGQGAGGGNIKVTTSPSATVLLERSLISASVADGSGGGGNISIDPQFVILQNSQILAQAAQGQGGAITIIANLFLSDANSTVNADSGSGVNGTITIQSPNAPISGQIQPLGKTPLPATSLLNQHCAALLDGQFSSFTVAGRDSLPTEPGSWLASPLAFATLSEGSGLGTKAEGGKAEGERPDIPLLSLRQIAPAGFLTQAFAVEEPTGCQS